MISTIVCVHSCVALVHRLPPCQYSQLPLHNLPPIIATRASITSPTSTPNLNHRFPRQAIPFSPATLNRSCDLPPNPQQPPFGGPTHRYAQPPTATATLLLVSSPQLYSARLGSARPNSCVSFLILPCLLGIISPLRSSLN